jgi:hypothetical protein
MQVLDVNGWHILMTHICGMPPKGGHLWHLYLKHVIAISACISEL